LWEIREGYDHDYKMGKRDEVKEAYDCGYEDGYKDAMEEMEDMHERKSMSSYRMRDSKGRYR
jgi:flagellar biosynthesis/type III secretory pathway protein FliH